MGGTVARDNLKNSPNNTIVRAYGTFRGTTGRQKMMLGAAALHYRRKLHDGLCSKIPSKLFIEQGVSNGLEFGLQRELC